MGATKITITTGNITPCVLATLTFKVEGQLHQLKLTNSMRSMDLTFSPKQHPLQFSQCGFPAPCIFPASRQENPAWIVCLNFWCQSLWFIGFFLNCNSLQLCFSKLQEKKTMSLILLVNWKRLLHKLACCVVSV